MAAGRSLDEAFTLDKSVISIDKEGNWFYNGRQIINKKIFYFFNQHLEKNPDGGYRLRIGQEVCQVLVEDTPFVVRDIAFFEGQPPQPSCFSITLNDGTEEQLDLESVYIGAGNVLYCEVKAGKFKARFLRPGYYRLAQHIQQEGENCFYISLNGKKFYVSGVSETS